MKTETKTTGIEKRLLSYKNEHGMKWKDICKCFPTAVPYVVQDRLVIISYSGSSRGFGRQLETSCASLGKLLKEFVALISIRVVWTRAVRDLRLKPAK
jgi:hypothetical protein